MKYPVNKIKEKTLIFHAMNFLENTGNFTIVSRYLGQTIDRQSPSALPIKKIEKKNGISI